MIRRYKVGLMLGLLALLLAPLGNSFASPTGFDIASEFQRFYDQSGGLPVFGYAVSDPMEEDGRLVQYFERQRLELHPENAESPYEVLLGHVGKQDAERRGLLDHEAFQPRQSGIDSAESEFFPQTGHNLSNGFRRYWHDHGLNFDDEGTTFRESLALFGFPISEEFIDLDTGLVTQYFERARFEFHPEHAGTEYEVLLGHLGNDEMEFQRAKGRRPDGQGPPGQRDQGDGDPTQGDDSGDAGNEPGSGNENSGVEPSTSIQELVDVASAGSTVVVPAGIYRETITINQPITLLAEPGAEIRGSDVWSGWSQTGGYWISSNTVPPFDDINPDRCESGSDGRCAWPEQVFVDGASLAQVASNPVAGQFAVNDNRNIMLADDPSGRTVEVTVREHWISAPAGGGNADDVTIDGFTMKHAATPYQRGAIQNMEADAWKIRNVDLSYSHSAAVWLIYTSDIEVTNSAIHHNGKNAVGLYHVTDGTVSGNRIYQNNTEAFDALNEAGGVKGTVSANLMVVDNEISYNRGPGLWADLHCDGWTIRDNRIHHNDRAGITYEVSFNGRIHDNAIWENGHGAEHPPTGAGINLQITQGTEVYNNVVAWNGDGIIVWDRERSGEWAVASTGNYIHDNDIFIVATEDWDEYGLAWIAYKYPGSPLHDGASGNRGANNRFFHANPGSERPMPFRWLDDEFNWGEIDRFNSTPGDENASYLSAADKDRILGSLGVSVQPGH